MTEVEWNTDIYAGTRRGREMQREWRRQATPILADIREQGLSAALKPYAELIARAKKDLKPNLVLVNADAGDEDREPTPEELAREKTDEAVVGWAELEEEVALRLLDIKLLLSGHHR